MLLHHHVTRVPLLDSLHHARVPGPRLPQGVSIASLEFNWDFNGGPQNSIRDFNRLLALNEDCNRVLKSNSDFSRDFKFSGISIGCLEFNGDFTARPSPPALHSLPSPPPAAAACEARLLLGRAAAAAREGAAERARAPGGCRGAFPPAALSSSAAPVEEKEEWSCKTAR